MAQDVYKERMNLSYGKTMIVSSYIKYIFLFTTERIGHLLPDDQLGKQLKHQTAD